MATKIQIMIIATLAVLALLQSVGAQGHSFTQLSNGLGFKYNYGIQHDYHGHAYGSSYPNGYGGFGAPAAGISGGYAREYTGGFAGGY
ncbi:probable peroxisomal membrane protein PEX13 [Zootermopsis nevadensis]|uniref:probable peroxisomal membrane protein PEX13 n=1 Tax=Zootermopsis nevadensis TaxID=136037 RepID=UPI000B8E4F9C|nr:probable peroxisomal membrane protein PEX13 [Zootermopsis nevadensis]